MSLLLGRRVWIVLLTYCLFFSCKTGDNEVSGLIQPKNQVQSTFFTDTFTLKTCTVLYDTIVSNVSQRLLVGQYVDGIFGTVTANAYAQFVLSNPFLTFGPNPILDSTLLMISFSSISPLTTPYWYGDATSLYFASIHRLTQSIIDTNYLTKSEIPYDPNSLGKISFGVEPPTYSVVLDNSLGQEFIDSVSNFSDLETFKASFKGLALIGKSSNRVIYGIENMRILLKFHNYYGLNNLVVNDSLSIYLNGDPKYAFSNIKLQTDGYKLSKLQKTYDTLSSDETQGECYIQANTGIGTKIRFTFIDGFRNSIKSKILIDRADLVIKPDIGQTLNGTSSLPPPPYLMAYELDSLGHVQTITTSPGISVFLQTETSAGIFGSTRPLVVPYDITNVEYRITMTSYIQALIDKNVNKHNYGLLFIGSNDIQSANNTNYYYSNINNVRFRSSDIKLQVYYSEYK